MTSQAKVNETSAGTGLNLADADALFLPLLKARVLNLLATPRVSDDSFVTTLDNVRRFGKWKVYGNNTQHTVAELTTGALVYLKHSEQEAPILKMLRKRLKGVYGNTGNGAQSTADAFGWEDDFRCRDESAGHRCSGTVQPGSHFCFDHLSSSNPSTDQESSR